jgi:hypothetical protein
MSLKRMLPYSFIFIEKRTEYLPALRTSWAALPGTEALETMSASASVMGGTLVIAVSEVVLHRFGAPVSEVVATGVSEHVGPGPASVGFLGRRAWRCNLQLGG